MTQNLWTVLQAILTAITGFGVAYVGLKKKKVDSHISDNQSAESMFKMQTALIRQMSDQVSELKAENTKLVEEHKKATQELTEKISNLERQNTDLAAQVGELSAKLEQYETKEGTI